jgi:hypothetical protein
VRLRLELKNSFRFYPRKTNHGSLTQINCERKSILW